MGPVTYTPHDLDATGSIWGARISRIWHLFIVVVMVETFFELSADSMPGFAMWVT